MLRIVYEWQQVNRDGTKSHMYKFLVSLKYFLVGQPKSLYYCYFTDQNLILKSN